MGKFCTKCGASLTGPFCIKCGADARNINPPAQSVPQPATPQPVQAPQPVASAPAPFVPAAAKAGMSPLPKLGIAAVVIIFVGGAAGVVGMYYVAHRISQKVHEVSNEIIDSATGATNPSSGMKASRTATSSSTTGSVGDVCRFLSKEDVGRAIGVEIVRADRDGDGCAYIAKGTPAEMTSKHITAMMAARGADKKTQEMIQGFTSGMGKMFESEKPQSEQDNSGEVPVFNFSVDQNAAETQLRLNERTLSTLGPAAELPGIGDQAFVSADGMIMLRKGKNLVRIMYIMCPCGTDAVKPLAKMIADRL